MVACQPEGGLDNLARPQRSHNGHRFRASAEVHGAQQPSQAEEMVTVQVRDNYGGNALQFDVVLADTVLRTLGAVEEHLETANVQQLCGTMAPACGQCGPGA
jgi:hypothetical protein